MSLSVQILRVLPKNAMSRLAGRVAGWRLPSRLQATQLRAFGRVFGVDFDEVRDPVESFECLQDFFIRELRDGVRPIDPDESALVAPCDGTWGAAGKVESGLLLQIKGRPYALSELLGDAKLAAEFEGGWFATFYLSPRDYHRFHTPCRVRIAEARYIPGSLWPVNSIGVEGVEGLFAENERIVAVMDFESASGSGRLCVAAVGATMVGKVKVRFDDLETNSAGHAGDHRIYAGPEPEFAKGEEWGHFEFGSTLVMVAGPGLELDPEPVGTLLKLGTRIGTLGPSS
jgi:phosphatidylserine decarboxylase